jgi:hypothetical protein
MNPVVLLLIFAFIYAALWAISFVFYYCVLGVTSNKELSQLTFITSAILFLLVVVYAITKYYNITI